jgi:hypothetical protein
MTNTYLQILFCFHFLTTDGSGRPHSASESTTGPETAGTSTTTTPAKLTCEQCLTKFLSSTQISLVTRRNLEQFCATPPPLEIFESLLTRVGVSSEVQAQLIQCLRDAGVVFTNVG